MHVARHHRPHLVGERRDGSSTPRRRPQAATARKAASTTAMPMPTQRSASAAPLSRRGRPAARASRTAFSSLIGARSASNSALPTPGPAAPDAVAARDDRLGVPAAPGLRRAARRRRPARPRGRLAEVARAARRGPWPRRRRPRGRARGTRAAGQRVAADAGLLVELRDREVLVGAHGGTDARRAARCGPRSAGRAATAPRRSPRSQQRGQARPDGEHPAQRAPVSLARAAGAVRRRARAGRRTTGVGSVEGVVVATLLVTVTALRAAARQVGRCGRPTGRRRTRAAGSPRRRPARRR